MTQSYEQCARSLLQERQLSRMPPFTHLCLLRIESAVAQQGIRFARQCFESAFRLQQQQQQIELIGPLPAPMERKAGRFRFQLHIKSASRPRLQRFLQALAVTIEAAKTPSQVRWSLDVDAQDLL
jgi:primosomal protein N' (replication factor Y)